MIILKEFLLTKIASLDRAIQEHTDAIDHAYPAFDTDAFDASLVLNKHMTQIKEILILRNAYQEVLNRTIKNS